jgi:NAD(P)-dependent dehydrogenase (short-subunit alcohol dehydrogenase family)
LHISGRSLTIPCIAFRDFVTVVAELAGWEGSAGVHGKERAVGTSFDGAGERQLLAGAVATRRGLVRGAAAGSLGIGLTLGERWAPGALAQEGATDSPGIQPYGDFPLTIVSPDYFVPNRLRGRVLLVTGAAQGTEAGGVTDPNFLMSIGAATAIRAAREGAKVACVDIKRDGLQKTIDTIAGEGHEAIAIEADVSDSDDANRMVTETVAAFGKLDLALNNAGVLDGTDPALPPDFDAQTDLLPAPVGSATDEYWDRVLATNITGVFKSLRAEVNQFVDQGTGGAIVNVGSIAGTIGLNGNCAYSASKHAVTGITLNAALDYARFGIRVNSVNMAQTDTPMVFRAQEFVKWARQSRAGGGMAEFKTMSALQLVNPMHPGSTPWEQAAIILFLLSDDASNLTGCFLHTDGGWTSY